MSDDLVPTKQATGLIPFESEWKIMKETATMLINTGFLPPAINTPQKAMALMLKGRELNIPPMSAIEQINIIQGKPAVSAELQLALIYRKYPNAQINFKQLSNKICEIHAARPGGPVNVFGFTIEDASQASLLGKPVWKQYPRAMLRSRCISEMARSLFPECILGLSHTQEELGAEVTITDSGDQVIVQEPVVDGNKKTVDNVEIPFEPEAPLPTEEAYGTEAPPPQDDQGQMGGSRKIQFKISEAQQRLIFAKTKAAGLNIDDVDKWIKETFKVAHKKDMTKDMLDQTLVFIEKNKL